MNTLRTGLTGALLLLLATAGTAMAQSPPKDITGELVVWHYQPAGAAAEGALLSTAALFNKEYPNVKVTFESFPFDQLTSLVLTAAGSGSGPDVIHYNWGDVAQLVESGAIVPLNDYLANWDEASALPDSVRHGFDDNIYAVQGYVNLISMWYNGDILSQLGLEPPKTFDELEAAMRAAKAAGYKGLTMQAGPGGVGGWWNGMPWMRASCVDITMSDQAKIESVLKRQRGWIEEGLMGGDVVTQDQAGATRQFLTGQYLFELDGNWNITRVEGEAKFKLGTFQVPTNGCPSSVYLGGEGISLGAFGTNQALAWEFVRLGLLSKEGETAFLKAGGSIPSRTDIVAEGLFKSNALETYTAAMVAGTPVVTDANEARAQERFGDIYSGALSGQLTPEEAAKRLVEETPGLLAGD